MFHGRSILVQEYKRPCVWAKKRNLDKIRDLNILILSTLPLLERGTCDSSVLPLFLIPGYTMPSQPGRHSGGAKPLERLHFLSFEQEHFFDLNFGTLC
jgi:hypothetical protein